MNWWLLNWYEIGGAVLVASWIFWVIFSITLHELAHGWAAIWQGDRTPIARGHMNMNPLTHMGPQSLIMFAIIGIAWGAMPIEPSNFRWKRRGRIVVAGAGPAMNIALGLVALTAAALWMNYGPDQEPLHENMHVFLFTGGYLNFALAAFNLLPIPGLDGSHILMGLSFKWYRIFQHPQAGLFGMFIIIAVFISGVGEYLFVYAARYGAEYMIFVTELLP